VTLSDLLRVAPGTRPELEAIDHAATPGFDGEKDTARDRLEELREELAARPGGEWVTRMYAEHRGAYAGVPDVVHH